MRQLSLFEETSLERDEAIIERGLESFVEVGTALLHIRDNRLYQKTHETFEDYCRERWDMTRGRINQIIRAVGVLENLDTTVSKPETESQTRPLASLPPAEQRMVWDRAVETAPNGRVTAAHVEQVKKEMTAPATIIVEDIAEEEPRSSPRSVPPRQAAAERWGDIEKNYCVQIRSFQKEGGIQTMTQGWSQDHLQEFLEVLQEKVTAYQLLCNEVEEMLSCRR